MHLIPAVLLPVMIQLMHGVLPGFRSSVEVSDNTEMMQRPGLCT